MMSFVPHLGQVHPLGASGFGEPHSGQNLLVMPLAPHVGQSQVLADTGSGFLAPHSGQNLLVMPLAPQAGQSQPAAACETAPAPTLKAGVPAAGVKGCWGCMP